MKAAPPELLFGEKVTLYPGDCLDVLDRLPEASFDSGLTDPPYHLLAIVRRFGASDAAPINNADERNGRNGPYHRASKGFMGKRWDGGDVAFRADTWRRVLRVMKPGAHLLAFGATRNYHRMACAIEDAGFEVRDMMQWLYGSGFPKALNIALEFEKRLCHHVEPGSWFYHSDGERMRREPPFRDPQAQEWAGWATALKPALEPICFARKPLAQGLTNAENVERFGVGALNIDGCRIETADSLGGGGEKAETLGKFTNEGWRRPWMDDPDRAAEFAEKTRANVARAERLGRWPANVIHDGSADVMAGFPESGPATSGRVGGENPGMWAGKRQTERGGHDDAGGSAGRFFYTAKADTDERAGSDHPTVKPLDLLQYLARLITPPGGSVLDLFAGTGTTGEAAWREGFRATLIEADAASCEDIRRRSSLALAGPVERANAITKARGKLEDAGGLPLFALPVARTDAM
jgi:site-specific DNA-methyltransferase (adenine-specific)